MIKIVFCLHRLASIEPDAFYRYWLDEHGPLVRECAPATRMLRYTQSHYINDSHLKRAAEVRGCVEEAFDGVAEVWWKSMDDLSAAAASPEGRAAARRMIQDERKFIDLSRSVHFYCEEHVVFCAAEP